MLPRSRPVPPLFLCYGFISPFSMLHIFSPQFIHLVHLPHMALFSNIWTVFSILCCFFLVSHSFEFVFNGFKNPVIVFNGSTSITENGALRLTDKRPNLIGHAFYPNPILMFNNSPNVSSFATSFVFQILPSDSNRGGYGFAFTLSPSPGFPYAEGKHRLGIFNSMNDGNSSNHIFVVEFDTVNGYNEVVDRDGNHISINLNGMEHLYSDSAGYHSKTGYEDVDLESGSPYQAWIEYDGLLQLMNVTVAPLFEPKPSIPLLSKLIHNLSAVLKSEMYAGFSAATAEYFSSHCILGWSFKLNGAAGSLDLHRLPVVHGKKSSTLNVMLKNGLIAAFSVLLFLLLMALGGIIMYRRLNKFEHLEDWELECPHRFRYRDLWKATKGFKESEMIGVGGFGNVYRGVLKKNGTEIAVKKIMSNNSLQGMREFAAEIESLGRLRHKNLVHLQGWCKHKNDLLLVYDYIPNGSLDSLLYHSKNGSTFLSWQQRFNIIKGIASGLLYLHEEWERVVIHRDVKSGNVLIDGDMNARLGDFGLARLYDHGKNSHTTNLVGTVGYIAPELTQTGKASASTDVFAFGILLLEIACGRAPVVCEVARNVILVDWIIECMQAGNIFNAVDQILKSDYVVEEMELVLGLGLLCSNPMAEARPSMRQVMRYLNGDESLPDFDKLALVGSRRIDEIQLRFLALGLSDSTPISSLYNSSSIGHMSAGSYDGGR